MSDFAGIETAKTSDRLPNLAPGCSYTLKVKSNKKFKSRKGETFFAAEFTILDAVGPNANSIGTDASWLVKMTGNDSALGNIKGYVAALIKEPVTKVTAAMCDELVADSNPAAGNTVRVTTLLVPTKKGTDFTIHSYSPDTGASTATAIPVAGEASSTPAPAKGKSARA